MSDEMPDNCSPEKRGVTGFRVNCGCEVCRSIRSTIQQKLLGPASPRESPSAGDAELVADLEKLAAETRALAEPGDQRVVCAACKWPDGAVVTGIRHFSPDMRLTAARMGRSPVGHVEEGFVDQWGNWLTRQEAYAIAERQGQYHPYEPFTPGTLYSEDLY